MRAHKKALLEWLRDRLGSSWRVQEVPVQLPLSLSRAVRVSYMGDPIRYVEVHYVPVLEAEDGLVGSVGRVLVEQFRFAVHLYLQYRFHERYELSSQYEWDEVLEGASGLLPALRRVVVWRGQDGRDYVIRPLEVEVDLVALDEAGRELAHHGRLLVGVSEG